MSMWDGFEATVYFYIPVEVDVFLDKYPGIENYSVVDPDYYAKLEARKKLNDMSKEEIINMLRLSKVVVG